MRYYWLEDSAYHQVDVEPLNTHPGQGGKGQVMEKSCQDGARNQLHLLDSISGIEGDHGDEADIQAEKGPTEGQDNLCLLMVSVGHRSWYIGEERDDELT